MTLSKKNSLLALATVALLAVSVLPANAATKAKPTTTPKPTVATAPRAGGFGGGANNPAFAKYTACLAKAGIKLPSFGGGRGPGTRPSGAPTGAPTGGAPRPRPTLSLTPAQQKAYTACAALRPSFGGFGRGGGTGAPTGGIPNGKSGGVAPKTGTSAAYIACLNTHGLPVKSAAEIAALDNQNTKVIAAEMACAGK
jgi:hypothetical protein